MDRFFDQRNIDRYRKLVSEKINATERLQIMKSLAQEEAKFKLDYSKVPADKQVILGR